MSGPAVSVVVPTFRRPHLLGRCLEALARQTLDPRDFEVIVVDDEPSPETRRVVERAADAAPQFDVRYLAVDRNRGPAAARNLGWRAAAGAVIAFTDDDCLPGPGWLCAGLSAMAAEGLAGVAGRIVVPRNDPPSDYELSTAGLEHALFPTANCFYRREDLQALGGFDERFTIAWREDSDLQFRMLESGRRLGRAENAIVVHPVRPAGWGISLREQRKSLFNALLYKKHPALYRAYVQSRPPLTYYAILGAAGTALIGLLGGSRRTAGAGAAAWLGLTGLFAARRLRHTRHDPPHLFEMAATSAAIPLLSVYWRIRGAIRFRVVFL
ncbi:MAG: glycosyltransferase family 2 protein [Hyphomicrobiales bacterium]